MKEILLKVLIIAYASVSVIRIIAYWPTIKDLYLRKKASANITSFSLWSVTSGITFLYSLFILSDFLFRVVSFIGFILCVIVLFLSIWLKVNTKK